MKPCPERTQLELLLAGRLDNAHLLEVDEHVESCHDCHKVLHELSVDPDLATWLKLMRHQHTEHESAEDQDAVQRLIAARRDGDPATKSQANQADRVTFPGAPTDKGQLGTVGHYHIMECVGEGGMGIVYKAFDDELQRPVALKILAPELAGNPDHRNRFRREAQQAAQVQQDNIVEIYEVHEGTEFAPYLVMEWIEGETLASRLKLHGPLSAREVAAICCEVAKGLVAAHEKEVVHRDIKCSNIMLDSRQARARITDFGLARRREIVDSDLTRSGVLLGTPAYMSTEQIRSPDQVDGRSDIYSLGVVLYECLTGELPFRGASDHDVLMQVVHTDPLHPRRLNEKIPRDLDTICLKCLEKSPRKRYGSARELADDLQRFLDGKPIHARPVSKLEKLYRWCRAKPAQALLVLFVVASLLAALGFTSFYARSQANAAAEQQRLREDADRSRYLAEVGVTSLQYVNLLNNPGSPAVTTYSAKVLVAPQFGYSLLGRENSVSSWETAWLQQFELPKPVLRGRLAASEWGILDVEVSHDHKSAVSVDESGLMVVWDLQTGRAVRQLSHGRRRTMPEQWLHHYLNREPGTNVRDWGPCYIDVKWLDEGKIVGASLDGAADLFDTITGERTLLYKDEHSLYCVAVSGGKMLFGDAAGGLTLRSEDGEEESRLETENGAVTVIHALPGGKGWVAGFDDGKVWFLDETSLERYAELETRGPVWSVDSTGKGEELLIAVGDNLPLPRLARLIDKNLEPAGSLRAPDSNVAATAFHQVAFGDGGKTLYGGGDGRLFQWKLESGEIAWQTMVANRDERNRPLEQFAKELTGQGLPTVFNRRVAAIHEVTPNKRLLTAGTDIIVKLWDVPPAAVNAPIRLRTRLGENPHIEFDFAQDGLLWGIGENGELHLVDVEKNRDADSRKAHDRGASAIAVAKQGDLVATVGGDKSIRLWRATPKEKITAAEASTINHAATLVSVALTEAGDLVAAVDVDARLGVWRTKDGKQIFLTDLSSPVGQGADTGVSRPLTGRVAFNSTGTLLAAFGQNQSGYLFSTSPFRKLDTQIYIAGNGGTAMVWNPKHTDVVFAGDDHPRYVASAVDRKLQHLDDKHLVPSRPCVAMKTTPDAKRIVCLEEGGRLVFMETSEHLQLLEITHPQAFDSDLSIDRQGLQLAIAGKEGAVEVLRVDKPAPETPPRVDRTRDWTVQDLVLPTALIPRAYRPSIKFDSRGRINMLAVLSRKQDERDEGELYFLRTDEDAVLRERITVDGTINDRRIAPHCTGLAIDAEDNPVVVFRRRTAVQSPYDGSLYSGRRMGPEDWEFNTLHAHGNLGYYPLLRLDTTGQPVEVRHFSFAGFLSVRSTPPESDKEWNVEYLGRVGDGFRMEHAETKDGAVHCLFNWNPFNGVVAPQFYSRQTADEYVREVIDPFAVVSDLRITADGSIFVMARNEEESYLQKRAKNGWERYCALPDHPPGDFEITPDGEVFVGPQWDSKTSEVLVWHRTEDKWTLEVIARGPFESKPNWLRLVQDHRALPSAVIGQLERPYGWIKSIRLK